VKWIRCSALKETDVLDLHNRRLPDVILTSFLAVEMIYDLINNFQVYLSKLPQGFGNFSFSIQFDEYLSLARSGFWRKKLEQKWLIPSASVL
jgi:hypothetical protein